MTNGSGKAMSSAALEQRKDEEVTISAENMPHGLLKELQKEFDKMHGVDPSSRPPSPPESGTTTPRLNIAPCPLRLRPSIPPMNYGAVHVDYIFRSSYPQDRNMDFVKTLRVRSLLTLVDTEPTPGFQEWIENSKVKRMQIHIATNKEGKVNTTIDSLCEALLFIMDSSNYPVYIHCNRGKHRTGCVVACLRKVQHWPIEKIIEEYSTYAGVKARDGDIELIKSFEPSAVFEYARLQGYFDSSRSRFKRMDSAVADIDGLAAALAAGAFDEGVMAADWDDSTISSSSSDASDSPLEMRGNTALMSSNSQGKMRRLGNPNVDMTVPDARGLSTAGALELTSTEGSKRSRRSSRTKANGERIVIMNEVYESEDSVSHLIEETIYGRA